ncbi:hypothetical protein WA577_005575, partial [Blastocystis sp. JDR]
MKRSGPQSADESTNSKRLDVEEDEIVTGTIHVADDSILVPSPSKDSEKLKEPKRGVIVLKSAFVTYNHTTIPPYDGVIGKAVSVPCCCVSLPLLPVVDESPKPIPEHDFKPMKLKYAREYTLLRSFVEGDGIPDWTRYTEIHMRLLKENETVPADYCVHPGTIKSSYRTKLLDWMAEVCHEFSLDASVLFLSFAIVDNFLASTDFPPNQLQCLGSAALLLASKLCTDSSLSARTLSDLSLHAFSPAEVTKLEGDVLAALNFSLHFVTPFDFLLHALAQPAVTPEEFFLSLYFLECAVIDGAARGLKPSQLAACCVKRAQSRLQEAQSQPEEEADTEMESSPRRLVGAGRRAAYRAFSSPLRCRVAVDY